MVILGAGASGLMCASVAAGRGKSVLILDHAAKPGRKLSITGGGKCNLTNRTVTIQDYAGENPHFCRSALSRFTPDHMLAMLHEAGIDIEEREHGQIFCKRSAKDLLNLLVKTCLNRGCRTAFEETILTVEQTAAASNDASPAGARFRVRTRTGEYEARSLVIAMGGPAWPQVGASGRGYELARAFGHRIVSIRPALAGLIMPPDWPLIGLTGISTPVSIRVIPPPDKPALADPPDKRKKKEAAAQVLAAENLDMLFTHKGISGPAALQASLYWRKGYHLIMDFLPGLAQDNPLDDPASGKLLCRNLFRRHLPDRLCDALLPPDLPGQKVAELPRRERDRLCALFRAHEVVPTGSEGFAKAEVTAGGVSTEEVSSRGMESARVPGLFFCGEVLDVTGRLGGYNLHWAFASGTAAGEHV